MFNFVFMRKLSDFLLCHPVFACIFIFTMLPALSVLFLFVSTAALALPVWLLL